MIAYVFWQMTRLHCSLWLKIHVYTFSLIHASGFDHLSWFRKLAIANSDSINTGVQVSL